MLTLHANDRGAARPWKAGEPIPDGVVWLDLLDADDAETAAVEKATGVRMPSRERISGIGLAGHNRRGDSAVYLHVARFAGDGDDQGKATSPLGIAINERYLVTQRYAHAKAFDDTAAALRSAPTEGGGPSVLAALMEALSGRLAATMQAVAGDLATLGDEVFVDRRLRTRTLRNLMLKVGRLEARLTRSRASLLGIDRVATYLCDRRPEWLSDEVYAQLRSVATDLSALDELDDHLTGKLQFLLDAILGFINTDQNEVMKLLTVASVVTIPPVILAGIWGMNFKHMPELHWLWGYPMALAALAVSIVLPLLWFQWRGWLSKD